MGSNYNLMKKKGSIVSLLSRSKVSTSILTSYELLSFHILTFQDNNSAGAKNSSRKNHAWQIQCEIDTRERKWFSQEKSR